MAPRASWKGYLKLSLVSCPVRLYNATTRVDKVQFNFLHKDTHNRIQMKPFEPELGQVERSDLVKGYQYEKNRYVVIDEEDLAKVKIESTETINIDKFVDRDSVDLIYQDSPYYLAPDGRIAEEIFVVLREAMRKANKIAIARVVLSGRERAVTIDVRDRGMLLMTLRSPKEIRNHAVYFEDIPENGVDHEMLKMAEQLVTSREGTFDTEDFVDQYEEALLELIKAKIKGEEPVISAEPERGKVINLMDALKQSLEEAGSKPPARSKTTRRKTAATKKPTTRKRKQA